MLSEQNSADTNKIFSVNVQTVFRPMKAIQRSIEVVALAEVLHQKRGITTDTIYFWTHNQPELSY